MIAGNFDKYAHAGQTLHQVAHLLFLLLEQRGDIADPRRVEAGALHYPVNPLPKPLIGEGQSGGMAGQLEPRPVALNGTAARHCPDCRRKHLDRQSKIERGAELARLQDRGAWSRLVMQG